MFDYNNMIQRAIQFFPTWSDIRKRYKKSTGGKLLSSITNETMELDKAIQEYKDSYFLDRDINDKIVDFCYCANIGIIKKPELLSLKYNDSTFKLIEDLKTFLEYDKSSNVFYYENGKVYIHEEKYITDDVVIIYDNTYLNYKLEKTHIWNLYDEFACFIGMERHPNETNKELYQRMLYFNLNKPNSSIIGLKHAIISELLIKEPGITEDEIQIEKVNETNLRKAYKDFNELLDFLNKINRDVYRWKRWDLDVWEYDFKNYSIEYLPYKWNEALVKWQNGIGYDDDLKVILSNNVTKTDANITLYQKDKETLLAYIRRKNIYKNIKLIFEAYNEKLNSINVKYLIKASPMKLLDPSKISIDVYEKSNNIETVNIQDIYEIGKDITKIENSKITDIYPYKLQFIPKDENYNMEIYKCNVIYRNKTTKNIIDTVNLLKEIDGFKFNSYNNLTSNSVGKTITSIGNMISYSNLKNIDNNKGFTITNGHTTGQGSININGLQKNAINYSTECEMSTLDRTYIKTKNCLWQNDKLILRNDIPNTKTVEIEINANKLSFKIESKNNLLVYVYNYETENYEAEQISGPNAIWTSKESFKPRKIKILISSLAADQIVLSEFKYSKYTVEFNVTNGKIQEVDNELILPNEVYNTLIVTLKSYSGYPPVVKGLYIGIDLKIKSYVTDIVYYRNNCERIFDIKSNCQVNLIKVDNNNNPINTIYDYNPSTIYKATSNDSYIRLNLDEWNEVDSINTPNGSIEYIEESGKIYYNLRLKNEESVSYINISGSKKLPIVKATLLDAIKQQINDFDITTDKVYCSKLLKGIAVVKNEVNTNVKIITIGKESFNRANAYRYEISDLPSDLNVIWGNDTDSYSDSFYTEMDFTYISFYPVNAVIHTATNEYNLFLNEIKDIKIVNNFNPILDTNQLLYYTVEPYNIDEDNIIDIRFYNNLDSGKNFDELKNWSIGYKNLYIKYDIDLFNKNIYEITEQTIQDNVKLDSYIEIKDQYTLSNNNTLYTQKYKIIPPDGATIIYKTYDGTEATKDLLVDEIIPLNNYFTKLKYANIDKVLSVKEYYNLLDNDNYSEYSLLYDEGIIIWNNYEKDKDKGIVLHIQYAIKKQIALSYDEDTLYDIIPYTVDAYKELSTYVLTNMQNKEKYNLNNLIDFKTCDLVYVSCSEPSFEAQMELPYLIFNKYAEENKLLVKTGYYYMNGKEYYLFSNDTTLEIDTYSGIDYKNINFNNGEIQTYKSTNNYVRNSSMLLRGMNNLYNYNSKDNLIYGISKFNSFTACNSFNDWHNFGCTLNLVSINDDKYKNYHINDVALEFIFDEDWGYAYFDITDYLYDNYTFIGFISYGLDVCIGIEDKFEDIRFNKALSIKLTNIIKSENEYKITYLNKEPNTKYYLVVRKNPTSKDFAIIDDIVISDVEKNIYSSHSKNIDLLDLNFVNSRTESSEYRMKITSNKYCENHYASICSDGKIKTTSNLNWGLTILNTFERKEDFEKCELENIKLYNDYIMAPSNDTAYLTTPPIFINDPYTVKRLFYKINNIDIKEMNGIKAYIYTCNEKDGNYLLYNQFDTNCNYVYGNNLSKYIKIKLEIPPSKVVDNLIVFAEYRSTNTNPLPIITQNSGYIISNIFDTQECLNYKIKSICISDISNINDVEIYVRSASDKYTADVWNEWKKLNIDKDLNIINDLLFENSRFFQIKIVLKTKITYIKFDYIDLEVI